ncbi:putative ribonuclease H-like domain-containing protein [Tanacetum coccineum]
MHLLSLLLVYLWSYDDMKTVGAEADFNNMDNTIDDESWVEAMQEELLQFRLKKVWVLIDFPYGKKAIGTKWVFRNKRDERIARIEAIRLFLAFASYMGFPVYQMDFKSAFLYGTIEKEVVKALYGLHQAPRAWYETLSTFLLQNGFRRGTIDKTLFIKKNKNDIIFQMSSMGEHTFFLGLQVKQQPDGIFISQDKYVADILKKFDFCSIRTATTPIESNKPLVKDEDGVDVDVHFYRSMIGSLKYLTTSRLDIMFAVCACARFQKLSQTVTMEEPALTGNQQQLLTVMVKNPVYHSRTKHIEIRHHFISDCYEKKLIDVIKIHTDNNVADLLTKGFDVTRFNFLVVSIGMLNP